MNEENAVKIIRTWITIHPILCPTQNVIDLKLEINQLYSGVHLISSPLFSYPTIVKQDDLAWLKGAYLVLIVYKNTFVKLNGYSGARTPIIKKVIEEERDEIGFDFYLGEDFALD
jgi:hypothetical protein